MAITLYHNPNCSKSRETLAIIQTFAPTCELTIIDYLNTPLSRAEIARLIQESGISVHQALRTDVPAYGQFIENQPLSDDDIIRLMATHPSLLNRPFASGEKGTRFCRPPELVKEIL